MDKQQWHVGKLMQTSSFYWQTCTLQYKRSLCHDI